MQGSLESAERSEAHSNVQVSVVNRSGSPPYIPTRFHLGAYGVAWQCRCDCGPSLPCLIVDIVDTLTTTQYINWIQETKQAILTPDRFVRV